MSFNLVPIFQMQEIYGASGYFMEAESTKQKKQLGTKRLTEVSVSDKLEESRASKEHFRGLSFPTTSSVGSNAAIIHYKPEAETCAELDPDCIYLFDSGAQVCENVLKGRISLGIARSPNGTNVFARIPLWKDGLDYMHGTGHGIGSYLNVHEGPHNISFRPSARDVTLQVSMAVTDEPGYYEDGNFGIRIENVLIVKEGNTKFNFGNKGYLSFEHITWAPYQRKLIDVNLLIPEEIEWLNEYHAKCREILTPYLNTSEMEWLKKATEPIAA
nr:aminopeptidase P1-like [Solanum lycopersicum]